MSVLRRMMNAILPTYDDERTFYRAHGRFPSKQENQRLRAARKRARH